jgi:hypothetical protein
MLVGSNGGQWGPAADADLKGAVDHVRLENPTPDEIAHWGAAGLKVTALISGDISTGWANNTYNTGGVQAINRSSWVTNARAWWDSLPASSQANIDAIEILNEPQGFWCWGSSASSTANAAAYAALLKAVRAAFPAPTSPPLLATWDASFDAWKADPTVANAVDGVVVHPYGGTGDRASSALGNRALVTAAHQATGAPVWITEIGWPTQVGAPPTPDSLQWSEADQATNITNFITWARSTGYVGAVHIFGWRDYTDHWYGIERYGEGTVGPDFSHKPGYDALRAAAHP